MVADMVFYNGKVLTQDAVGSVAEAVAISGNKIICTGTTEQMKLLAGLSTDIYDLKGRTVLPGLIDAHSHFIGARSKEISIDLSPASGVKSVNDILEKVKQEVSLKKPGVWIRGFNYDHNQLTELRHPNIAELDQVAPDHPVMLVTSSIHAFVLNSKAFEQAGVDESTPTPKGGEIEKKDGKLTGLIKETAFELIKPYQTFEQDLLVDAMESVDKYYSSNGITTAIDMGMIDAPEDSAIRQLLEMIDQGRIKTRVIKTMLTTMGGERPDDTANLYLRTGLRTGFGNEKFKLGPYKIMFDGSPEIATAALDGPYAAAPETKGLLYVDEEEFYNAALNARIAGWQVCAHVIGERAVRLALDAFERCENELKGKLPKTATSYAYRLEHLCYVNPEDLPRFNKIGVQPVVNPAFHIYYNQEYDNYVGDEKRVELADPVKSFLDYNLPVAAGSDCPVCPVNPFLGIEGAITRKTCDGRYRNMSEAVTLQDVLKMYTYYGAIAAGEERVKGSLEPGKLADLVVLSEDISTVNPEEISKMEVDMTVIDGECVYES